MLLDYLVGTKQIAPEGNFYFGTVTGVPGANQFTIPSLALLGAGKFIAVGHDTNPYGALVVRDAAGLGGAPQGEVQIIIGYDSPTGTFTTNPFSVPVAAGDQIMIKGPSMTKTILLNDHFHEEQRVAPSGAASILVSSAGGAWTLGAFSADIIAAGFVPARFDIHWVDVANISANAEYEMVFYYGPADTEACRIVYTRSGPQLTSFQIHTQTEVLPIGSRIRAKLMDSAGGGATNVKICYHQYRF